MRVLKIREIEWKHEVRLDWEGAGEDWVFIDTSTESPQVIIDRIRSILTSSQPEDVRITQEDILTLVWTLIPELKGNIHILGKKIEIVFATVKEFESAIVEFCDWRKLQNFSTHTSTGYNLHVSYDALVELEKLGHKFTIKT